MNHDAALQGGAQSGHRISAGTRATARRRRANRRPRRPGDRVRAASRRRRRRRRRHRGGGVRSDAKYLEISHLTKMYPTPDGGEAVIVRDFDLAIGKGEFVCLIGHSGCGKSTVLSIAAGLLPPTEGGVLVDDKEIPGPGPGPRRRVPVALPAAVDDGVRERHARRRAGASRTRRAPSGRRSSTRYLERVGLGDAMHKQPAELSAGMRQRVGLARAFALDPKMLLLDEPFGMLDSLTRFELQEVLVETWSARPQDRADGHARRRRGAVPVRPHRDDDQRPGGARSAASWRCRSRARARAPRCWSTPTTTCCASS